MVEVELPEGWIETTLDQLSSDISYGYTASASNEATDTQMLRITDIQQNRVEWSKVPFCEIDNTRLEKYKLKVNDLVFARTGATVGKSFLIKDDVPDAVYASYLIRVRCASCDIVRFLSYFFNSQSYWQQMTGFSAGIGQPNVNGTKLKSLIVCLPPLAEQKVIAEKLFSILAQVEATKTRLDHISTTLKTFRQSVLAAAVSGKLIEDWRGDVAYRVTDFGFSIPKSWKMETINEIAHVKGGKRLPKGENLLGNDTGYRYIRAGQLKKGTVIVGEAYRNKQLYLTSEVHEKIKRYTISKGDAYLTNKDRS